jgi:hypothetical protein
MLNPDYRDMLSALSAEGVEYLVVGAYALAAHGLPRATGDIDFWVRPSAENAERVLAALHAFGAPIQGLTRDDLERAGTVYQIGVAPRRVDLLTSIDGVEFDDAWPRRVVRDVDGMPVPVLSREDLLRNKRATNRPKDKLDADWLENHPD